MSTVENNIETQLSIWRDLMVQADAEGNASSYTLACEMIDKLEARQGKLDFVDWSDT